MTKHDVAIPAIPSKRELEPAKRKPLEISAPWPLPRLFFSFTHTYAEITSDGDKAQVRARRTTLQDGKVTTESFEGEIDRKAFDDVAQQTHRMMQEQLGLWLRAVSWFLPRPARSRDER